MQPANPTRKQKVFEFILKFKAEHDGNSPTIRGIGDACDIPSTSTVEYYLSKLEREGLIDRCERKSNNSNARMIRVAGGQWSPPVITSAVAA